MQCISNGTLNRILTNLSPSTNVRCLLSKNPKLKQSYEKAKELDNLADKYQSNQRLIEAIDMYKDLIINHDKELNDTILKEIGVRCIERMRFLGKLKAAIEIHRKVDRKIPRRTELPKSTRCNISSGQSVSLQNVI